MIDYALRRRDRLELLFHRPPGRPPEDAVARAEREAVALLAREIERGVEAGALTVGDPATTASLLFWAVHGALLELAHGARSRDPGRLRAGALELARRAVGPS